jgi:8-oxo-dGTP pyrophosphatase MutT (NUDIX family)
MLLRDGFVLAEQRRATKRVLPGVIALPGSHVEQGESIEAAVCREIDEELGVRPGAPAYVCTLLHRSEEFRKLHYFAVTTWTGVPVAREAESLLWVPLNELETLALDVDRLAVGEYGRLFQA